MHAAPFRLTRTFSITSFIGIAVLAAALGVLYQWMAENSLIEHESEANADLALALSNALPAEQVALIREVATFEAEQLHADPRLADLHSAMSRLLHGLRVDRIKIYDTRGRLIFTTTPQSHGMQIVIAHKGDPGVRQALSGQVYSRLVPASHYAGEEHGSHSENEASELTRRLIRWLEFGHNTGNYMASYVPLHGSNTKEVLGVFEIYTDITPLVRSKDRSGLKILASIVLLMLLLYLFLLLIVRRAERIIRDHERLTRVQQEERIRYLAHHDELTGLPNRALFGDLLGQSIRQRGELVSAIGVFALGIDRFRMINDSLGHEAGDQVLAHVAERITRTMSGRHKAYRVGGDEFVVVDEFIADGEEAGTFAERLIAAVGLPMRIQGEEISISASVGIALFPQDGREAEALLNGAMGALVTAKRFGGGHHAFHTEGLNSRNRERLELEMALRRALELEQFELHYQPKINTSQGKVVGVESLLRWHHPRRGMISPGEFIPLLESTGLMVPVGAWVIEQACLQGKIWRDAGLGELNIAVNVSIKQFSVPQQLLDTVRNALAVSGLAPHQLELELTESLLVEDLHQVVETLARLKTLGVRLSIDDFGTGYSSLAYLTHLPIDTLKIDMSFIRNILVNEQSASITNAIISLARSLDLGVVAEGVESREQMSYVNALGCHQLQGYFFSPPVVAHQLQAVIGEIDASLG